MGGGQAGDGWNDPEGICSQEDDMPRMPADSIIICFFHMGEGISGPGVFSEVVIVKVYAPAVGVELDVLNNRAELAGCPVYFGLTLLG